MVPTTQWGPSIVFTRVHLFYSFYAEGQFTHVSDQTAECTGILWPHLERYEFHSLQHIIILSNTRPFWWLWVVFCRKNRLFWRLLVCHPRCLIAISFIVRTPRSIDLICCQGVIGKLTHAHLRQRKKNQEVKPAFCLRSTSDLKLEYWWNTCVTKGNFELYWFINASFNFWTTW